MQDLRVTLVQANQIWEDKNANLAHYDALLATIDPTDLIVFPEMFHTSFTMNADAMAESMENSIGITWLQQQAKKHRTACYASLIIREKDAFYNRGIFVFPNGEIHYYDKRKRFAMAGEDRIFSAGNTEQIVVLNEWKLNLQICYDLRFPENIRNGMDGAQARYDVLLYIANWPERRKHHWNTLLTARAIENQSYVVGVNRVGTDGNGLVYSGNSACFDALGNTVASCTEGQETVCQFTLSAKDLCDVRTNLPFLTDSSYRLFDI
jgi:predicted amidohydrolase